MNTVYLASKSPRRKELLKKIIKDFTAIEPQVEETESGGVLSPKKLALYNARIKAEYVYNLYGGFAIGADTVVELDGKLFFKPQSVDEARAMLQDLSGKTHKVITGVCVIGQTAHQEAVTSYVTFNDLSDQFIESYIKSGSPFDKAGGYGIQDSENFCKKLVGSKLNVIGFPVKTVKRLLILSGCNLTK